MRTSATILPSLPMGFLNRDPHSVGAPRLVAFLLAFVLAASVHAHPGVYATALVKIEEHGQVTVTVRADILAFAIDRTPMEAEDPPMNALLDGPDGTLAEALVSSRNRFNEQFALEFGGVQAAHELLGSPTVSDIRGWERSQAVRALPARLDFIARAQAPTGRGTLVLRFPPSLGDVITTFDRMGQEPVAVPLRAGESSPEIEIQVAPLAQPTPQENARSRVDVAHTDGARMPSDPPSSILPSGKEHSETLAHPLSSPSVFGRYLWLGITHIVPLGLDHVLFVLGLFLLSPRLKPLLLQVTAFTLAHTITLALTILGTFEANPAVVEPLIAASIAFIGIENLIVRRVHPWRPVVVFAFGLFHGMGFAGVLTELGLPRGQLANALISFNVGVEIAQLGVIGVAWLLVGHWRDRPWYRARVTLPASLAIALLASYWTIERLL